MTFHQVFFCLESQLQKKSPMSDTMSYHCQIITIAPKFGHNSNWAEILQTTSTLASMKNSIQMPDALPCWSTEFSTLLCQVLANAEPNSHTRNFVKFMNLYLSALEKYFVDLLRESWTIFLTFISNFLILLTLFTNLSHLLTFFSLFDHFVGS